MPVLRPATLEDVPGILSIYNHAVLNTVATADYVPQAIEIRTAWFEDRQRLGLPILVLEEAGLVTAWAALNPYNPRPGYRFTVENSVYVHPDHQGRGHGKTLLTALIDEARQRGLRTIIASIDSTNAASLRMHEAFGFVEAGRFPNMVYKFDQWLTVIHLQLDLG